jgi:tRNA U34 5-methylaminomethyl-2-thiouridine-forming methyltransferase MnmC
MVIPRNGANGWKKGIKYFKMKENETEFSESVGEVQHKEGINPTGSLKLVKTNDGSSTIFHPGIGEHYHSHHGALQESKHVFLGSGLQFFLEREAQNESPIEEVSILEVGFGTGLNYLLTADYCFENKITLHYTGIERFPLPEELINETGYSEFVNDELANSFQLSYQTAITNAEGMETQILSNSFLEIAVLDAMEFQSNKQFDVLYFDAFSAIHQPEMWTKELLAPICNFLKPGGVFITYAITGNLKRILKSLGFQIEKVPGAPGKREMLRAIALQ